MSTPATAVNCGSVKVATGVPANDSVVAMACSVPSTGDRPDSTADASMVRPYPLPPSPTPVVVGHTGLVSRMAVKVRVVAARRERTYTGATK